MSEGNLFDTDALEAKEAAPEMQDVSLNPSEAKEMNISKYLNLFLFSH